jgi:solute:Na+ symporter, SSS family
MATVGFSIVIPFVTLLVLFIILGFCGKYWRRGNLNEIYEWSLAGRRHGTTIVFLLIGADIYTSYAFVALPSEYLLKAHFIFSRMLQWHLV